jgi:hypothetical protein
MTALLARGLLLVAGLILAACQHGPRLIEKDAQSDELLKETTVGVPLPPGCPTLTASVPAGEKGFAVSYQEPKTNQNGFPLTNLSYTTIYLSTPKGLTQSLRIWTTDPRGGALVTVRNISPPAQEFGLCATATNWAMKESALPSPAR